MAEVQILVIHVRGQEERKAFIQAQLDKLSMPYHYILDGNVEDITPEILERYFANDGKPNTMYGQFPRTSCAYKHMLAAQYILENDLDGALIIEDDLRLYPSFKRLFMKSLNECAEKYADIPVLVNYEESSLMFVPRSQRVKGQILYPMSHSRYTGCLYLNRQGARVIMDYIVKHKSDRPIDLWHNQPIQEGLLTSLWSHPCLACQCSADGSMPTMISTKPKPLKRLKWFFKRFYKHLLYFFR